MSFTIDESESLSLLSVDSSAKKSRKSSPVHDHCRTPTAKEKEEKPDKRWLWYKHCSYAAQSTTNIKNHLLSVHDINILLAASNRTRATETVDALYDKLLLQLRDKDNVDQEILRRTVSQPVVDSTLLNLVIVRQLPFSCVEWPEFHSFVQALNPEASTFIPLSHNTLKARVSSWYVQAKDIVRKRLQSSQTSIHLAVDIWTSPSNDLLLAVCASFVDIQGSFRNILIGLRVVRGHSGPDQWEALLPVLQEYGIEEKIGAVVGDNSGTNDTLCRTIASYLSTEKRINWTHTHLRLRCMGHILNLVVQAFLFTNSEDEKEMESYDEEDMEEDKEGERERYARERAAKIRTKMGVMGKVHNIVVHIRASPQRITQFKAAAGKTIPLDNRTRWNSWFRMLQTTLEEPVLNAVRNYTEKHIAQGTLDKKDDLSNTDIALLRTIANFLGVFDGACLWLQGQQSTIERVLEAIDIIKEHLEVSLVCRTIKNSACILTYIEKCTST